MMKTELFKENLVESRVYTDVDPIILKCCNTCHIEKPLSEFYRRSTGNYRHRCKKCHLQDLQERKKGKRLEPKIIFCSRCEKDKKSKRCPRCKIRKSKDSFYKSKSGRISSFCKDCDRKRKRDNYQKNREKCLLEKKEYYLKNRFKILKRAQEARKNDPEYKERKRKYDKARNNDPKHKEHKREYDKNRNQRSGYGWKKPSNYKDLPVKTWIIGNHKAPMYIVIKRRAFGEAQGFAKRFKRMMKWNTDPFILCVDDSPYLPKDILALLQKGNKKQFRDRTLVDKLKEENADIWRYYTLEG